MSLKEDVDAMQEAMQESELVDDHTRRHAVLSQSVLTVIDDETADMIASHVAARIEGKTVIEIGGGIGLLAFHLGQYAKRVWCIEANPAWMGVFVGCLFAGKPKNVSYLFGSAEEFAGTIKGDVAIFCTHSGVNDMRRIGKRFAPEVIDVYGELIAASPEKFDRLATLLRPYA